MDRSIPGPASLLESASGSTAGAGTAGATSSDTASDAASDSTTASGTTLDAAPTATSVVTADPPAAGAGATGHPEGGPDDSGGAPRSSSGGDSGASDAPPDEDPEGRPFSPMARRVFALGAVAVLVAALVLRFWTRSDLWLDEALTVDIARQPLHQLPYYLKRDGAPPLFYVLLHVWMGWFGTSDLAVRSLPGVIGVATLPLTWLAGCRMGGKKAGWAALLLLTTSPFAVRYDTETRMYSLVALLTVVGFLALDRTLRRPRPGNLIAVGLTTGLLLYTHYWSVYLIGVTFLWLVWEHRRGRPEWRPGAKAAAVAVAVGCLTFLPWLPTFLYQSKHTGTPWATPASFAAMVNAVATFAGGGTSQGRVLALIFFALVGIGVFGAATGRHHIELDLRTRPLGRPLAVIIFGTLAAAIVGGFASKSAFDPRYASVVFIPLILLVAIGLTVFRDRRIRTWILVLAMAAGLASSIPNITTNRTQAGEVAAALATHGSPGDVVAYCPDQLGPAVNRLLPTGRYDQTTFPHGTGPEFVDWVDYQQASRAGKPVQFAEDLEHRAAAGGHKIFVVWAPGYQTLGTKCEAIVETLQSAGSGYQATPLVTGNTDQFYQPMWLVELTPLKS